MMEVLMQKPRLNDKRHQPLPLHAAFMQSLPLQEVRPSDDPADLIFMEPELLFVHPSEDSYKVAQRRAINAVRIFRGTHPDAVYLSKEIRSLCIPHERRIADIIKVSACFTLDVRPSQDS